MVFTARLTHGVSGSDCLTVASASRQTSRHYDDTRVFLDSPLGLKVVNDQPESRGDAKVLEDLLTFVKCDEE